MYRYIVLIQIIVLGYSVMAQDVVVKGTAKSYAGDSLALYKYSDRITETEKQIAKCKVSDKGDFEFRLTIAETTQAFMHLNVFRVFLYLEPNKQYEVVLPKKTKKLPEDELNPFFKEADFNLRILNAGENDLNSKIRKFDKLYNAELNKYFKVLGNKVSKNIVDSIVSDIDKKVVSESGFLHNYKTYSYAILRYMAYNPAKEKLIKQYFYNKDILYNNPAYMDLFKMLFDNYLSTLSKQEKAKKIPYYLVRYRSLSKIKSVMDSVSYLGNDTLQELIICKSLYDNFYKEDYPPKAIIAVIDSVKQNGVNIANKQIARNIFDKITSLLIGYDAPSFKLPNKRQKLYSLSKFKGKFVYLSFINPKSYTCQKHLELLKNMHEKQYKDMEIVSICVCDDLESMKSFVKSNNYKWTFLYYNNNDELLRKYKVKVYPTYYLINPDGKLTMSPAFPPTENTFEARYADIIKSWERQKIRRKAH